MSSGACIEDDEKQGLWAGEIEQMSRNHTFSRHLLQVNLTSSKPTEARTWIRFHLKKPTCHFSFSEASTIALCSSYYAATTAKPGFEPATLISRKHCTTPQRPTTIIHPVGLYLQVVSHSRKKLLYFSSSIISACHFGSSALDRDLFRSLRSKRG